MILRVFIGVIALIPAAFNVAPAAAKGLVVPLCTGDGLTESVTLPIPVNEVPGKEQPGCCAKACHIGTRKKNLSRQIDAGQ